MILDWRRIRKSPERYSARSCPEPHQGMFAYVRERPDGTWFWEIRSMYDSALAGHYDDGKRLKDCTGICPTRGEAMRAAETDMDEALA